MKPDERGPGTGWSHHRPFRINVCGVVPGRRRSELADVRVTAAAVGVVDLHRGASSCRCSRGAAAGGRLTRCGSLPASLSSAQIRSTRPGSSTRQTRSASADRPSTTARRGAIAAQAPGAVPGPADCVLSILRSRCLGEPPARSSSLFFKARLLGSRRPRVRGPLARAQQVLPGGPAAPRMDLRRVCSFRSCCAECSTTAGTPTGSRSSSAQRVRAAVRQGRGHP